MDLIRDPSIDPAPLSGRKVAILGYGNQGRAQARNLQDSGIAVTVGLREGSPSHARAQADGLATASLEAAAAGADLTMFLTPDETIPALYELVAGQLAPGSAIGFSHGLAVHFGLVSPDPRCDVILVAPKGPGSALRSLYEQGKGMVALWAVAQDHSGGAAPLALAYGRAIGCGRAGMIASSFAEECEADLFNEHAVVWGAVPEILAAGFQTLVDAGVSEEVAYLECVGELSLIAGLIEERGIAGMREAISNTAELGAQLGGAAVIGPAVREAMRAQLDHIRSGAFAADLQAEAGAGYPRLRAARARARASTLEATRLRLSGGNGDGQPISSGRS